MFPQLIAQKTPAAFPPLYRRVAARQLSSFSVALPDTALFSGTRRTYRATTRLSSHNAHPDRPTNRVLALGTLVGGNWVRHHSDLSWTSSHVAPHTITTAPQTSHVSIRKLNTTARASSHHSTSTILPALTSDRDGAHQRRELSTEASTMYTASFAFFEAIWEAGITHCFVNLGSDHPSIIEAMVKGQREKSDSFPRIITCPNEVRN
jgi:hypothetical protein